MQIFKGFTAPLLASFMLAQVAYAFYGDATYFHTGLGSCGYTNDDSQYVVALSAIEANGGAHCGQSIRVQYGNNIVDAVVADTCPECSQYSIDLTPSAFQQLAPLDAGRIQVDWYYL